MSRMPVDRRAVLRAGIGASVAVAVPRPAVGQGAARVVVVGGGFAGTACARALKRIAPEIAVTLVEANPVFTACPMSNAVIGGLRPLRQQQFDYAGVAAAGIAVVLSAAIGFSPDTRSVTLADGGRLTYDRLVLAPGVGFRWDAISGYSREVAGKIPHAWIGGAQIDLLRRQLEAMRDGGTVVIAVPVNPARCPPAPYERASLIAHYLKARKPRSKLIVLDAKDEMPLQRQFQAGWAELYQGVLEWVPLSGGGRLVSLDANSRILTAEFDEYRADVANVIPPQKAGDVTELAGVADRTGWCPVEAVTFESTLQRGVHVIGDAAIAGALPKAASAAVSEAVACATAIAAALNGRQPPQPMVTSACYSLIAPDYAISLAGQYRPESGEYREVPGAVHASAFDAAPAKRAAEARRAAEWYDAITQRVFG